MLLAQDINFLKELHANNDRNWFAENKSRYDAGRARFTELVNRIEEKWSAHDEIERTKIYRIYRDVRFSKDKTPYKTNFSAAFTRAGKYRRGGLYLEIGVERIMLGGGFWGPNSKDLKYIREAIIANEAEYRSILDSDAIRKYFGGLMGDAVKTVPRGFDKECSAIDLIRNKQFLLMKSFDESEVLAPDFADRVVEGYANMLPYFKFMSEALVFDGNGLERE